MGSNGYNTSLLGSEDGKCWLCGEVGDTARHEIFRGTNRANSKKYGLWVAVCPRCHKRLHTKEYQDEMHRIGQTIYQSTGATKEDFRAIFGKSYL